MKTQCEKILEILKDGQWHCVQEMIDTYSVDYRSRLCRLKREGYKFENRTCENPNHHHMGRMKEWRLKSSVAEFASKSDKICTNSLDLDNDTESLNYKLNSLRSQMKPSWDTYAKLRDLDWAIRSKNNYVKREELKKYEEKL